MHIPPYLSHVPISKVTIIASLHINKAYGLTFIFKYVKLLRRDILCNNI